MSLCFFLFVSILRRSYLQGFSDNIESRCKQRNIKTNFFIVCNMKKEKKNINKKIFDDFRDQDDLPRLFQKCQVAPEEDMNPRI